MIATDIAIREFSPADQPWFEKLNRAWIEKYFEMEPVDQQVLGDPQQYIIDKGGKILMAQIGEEIIGTVALKKVSADVYEFTKMAVDEKFQGKKIGFALSHAALDLARSVKAKRVILYSSTKLQPALTLYRKIGFYEVPVDGPYKRSDIKMEILL